MIVVRFVFRKPETPRLVVHGVHAFQILMIEEAQIIVTDLGLFFWVGCLEETRSYL